jgi:hypothetical protein
VATKQQLDKVRDAIYEVDLEMQFALQHGYDAAYERLRDQRKTLVDGLRDLVYDTSDNATSEPLRRRADDHAAEF